MTDMTCRVRLALLFALLALACAAATAAPVPPRSALVRMPGSGAMSLVEAQKRCSFVIYLPMHLPEGAGKPQVLFAPEQNLKNQYVPERVYLSYPNGMTLWEVPAFGRALTRPSMTVPFGDRVGWGAEGPGEGRSTLEWIQGQTQIGLTAALPFGQELFMIAGSAAPAAPNATMAQASEARKRLWGLIPVSGAPLAGIGAMLAPGTSSAILSVEPGFPAARAGLRAGDVIVAVDDRPVTGLPPFVTTGMLRGRPGTTVRMTVRREGNLTPLEFELEREVLPLLDIEETTLAQARAKAPFTLLTPGWMPEGYRLLTVNLITRGDKPSQMRMVYSAAGRPLVVITEGSPHQRAQALPPGGPARKVTVGAASGLLATTAAGLSLSWTRGGTAVLLQTRALSPAETLQVARSMR